MRAIYSLIFFIAVLTAQAQPTFEGIIELKMSSNEHPDMGRTIMYFSNYGGRLDTEMKLSPTLKNFKTIRIFKKEQPEVYYILNESASTYSITDLSGFKPMPVNDNEQKVRVIGTEKILGYNCTHSIVSTKSGEIELWTTKELMDYNSYKYLNESDAKSRNASLAKSLIEANAEGFPVKTIRRIGNGSEITIELVKADKTKLESFLFEIPTGYTKTTSPTSGMEGMMQEIKQMGEQTIKEE